MELTPGTKLGPYEIVSRIGAGGMAEVFKARDTRLDRTVAVKVMPQHIAARADLRARFEREARTVSNLNHPNICVLFDIGSKDGTDFMVLEYLEGETLAARIAKGPLPLDQALKFAMQIADALDRAHRNGVVHRDVKPANIMITRESVKVLDFGLAKSAAGKARADDATLTIALTEEGVVVGTPQYMAPELYAGVEGGVNADIFGYGCVLYEMVTGKRAFDGKTRVSVVASVTRAEPPPMSAIMPVTPAALERLVKGCLVKNPDERYQSLWDVLIDLKAIAQGETEVPARARASSPFAWMVAASVLAVAVAGLALLDWRRGAQVVASPPSRLTMDIAPAEALGGNREFNTDHPSRPAIAISPDGNTVVFSARRGGVFQLYKRTMDRLEAAAMPGTEGAIGPFFSADGQWIGFWARGKLMKISLNGGPAAAICDVLPGGAIWGASWSVANSIVFAVARGTSLMQVPAVGGTPQTLLRSDTAKGEIYASPEFLPDGKTLLFTVRTSDNWEEAQIVVRRLDTGLQRTLFKGGADARYVPTGHLVYMLNAVLMTVPFDARTLELTGPRVAILDGVMQGVNEPNTSAETGMGQFAISASGSLIYASGGIFPPWPAELVSVDRKGTQKELKAPRENAYYNLRLSPDGQRLAVARPSATSRLTDIWVVDMSRGTLTRLTSQGTNSQPLWSPDGKRILFGGGIAGQQIFSVAADGSGAVEPVVTSKNLVRPASWSRDGKWLAYLEYRDGNYQIWTRPMSGEGEPRQFLSSPRFSYTDAEFSPDGRWMVYVSNESGANEVYVQAFPGPGDRHQISSRGGNSNPMWAPNGRELFYTGRKVGENGPMMAVDVAQGAAFKAGTPHMLFEGSWQVSAVVRSYDMTPDGQHFVMSRPGEIPDQKVTKLNVVLNWFDELRKRAPRSGQ